MLDGVESYQSCVARNAHTLSSARSLKNVAVLTRLGVGSTQVSRRAWLGSLKDVKNYSRER